MASSPSITAHVEPKSPAQDAFELVHCTCDWLPKENLDSPILKRLKIFTGKTDIQQLARKFDAAYVELHNLQRQGIIDNPFSGADRAEVERLGRQCDDIREEIVALPFTCPNDVFAEMLVVRRNGDFDVYVAEGGVFWTKLHAFMGVPIDC